LWGYMSGMEIALYGSVLLGALVLYLNEREEATFPRLRWLLFLLAASRPEGAILCGVLGLVMAHDRWRASRAGRGPHFLSPALLLFAALSFFPRRRPWSDGRVLFLLFPAAVIVASLPVAWSVHLYRYQQGFSPVVLACYAPGLARAATLAWARLPRRLGAPLA